MATIVDARGKACPQPVIDTKNAIREHGAPVITLVDNDIARQNVEKMAAQMGLAAVTDVMEDGTFRIVLQPVASEVLGAVLGGGTEPAAGPGDRAGRHARSRPRRERSAGADHA